MVAHASIRLLDTGGIPASSAASAEGMVTLGAIVGVLVVVTVACLFVIGYREWRAERTRAAGSASAPMPRRATLRGRLGDRATPVRVPRLAGTRRRPAPQAAQSPPHGGFATRARECLRLATNRRDDLRCDPA